MIWDFAVIPEGGLMERKTNNQMLVRKGLTSKGQIYFFQRWLELLNQHTLDSYQYRVLNAHGALHEILEIIDSIRIDNVHVVNLAEAQAECLELLKADSALLNHADALRKQLMQHLGHRIRDDRVETSLLRLKYQVTYALKHIEPQYLFWLVDDLKDAIQSDNIEAVERLTLAMVSELVRAGRWPKALYDLREIFEKPRHAFEQKWTQFIAEVTSREKQYVCVFPADNLADSSIEDILAWRQAGLTLELGKEIRNRLPNVATLQDDTYYICAEADAMDSHQAFLKAIGDVGHPLDTLTFFQSVPPWPSAAPWAYVAPVGEGRAVRLDYGHITKEWARVEHSVKVRDAALRVIRNQRLDERSLEKVHGALLYAKLSSVSPFQEVRFMNLWVALESLVRTGQHENIIGHVKAVVPAATSVRYFYRLLRNFAEDCKRCEVSIETTDGFVDPDEEPKSRVAQRVLAVLRDDRLYAKLRSACAAVNELLAYRCDSLKAALKTGKDAATTLSAHHQRVSWHLQRLYRIRNAIAHSAHGSHKNLTTYIKTLREYLSITITEAIYHLEAGNYTSLEESFASIQDNHVATVEALRFTENYDQKLLLQGALFSD